MGVTDRVPPSWEKWEEGCFGVGTFKRVHCGHSGFPGVILRKRVMVIYIVPKHVFVFLQLSCGEAKVSFLFTWYFYVDKLNTYTAKPVCWNGWISDSYCSLKRLCSGMGEIVPARTSYLTDPTSPSPRTVLSLSCFKVSQCINCRD